MRFTRRFLLSFSLLLLCGAPTLAAEGDKPAANKTDAAVKPLKVLYITGGGYHDYKKLTPIITEGIAKTANVEFDVKWDLEPLRDKQLGEGYDAIVYNLCFAAEKNPELIENALRVTRAGKPTVLVHCSMHCFMTSDAWTECCGQRTRRHDKYRDFGTVKATDHPAIKHFPADWKTAGDELYQTIEFPATSTALLKARSIESDKDHVVCWVHQYGNGNVFATTLGHDTKTVEQPAYLRLLADGLLWSCGKLDAEGNPKPGYGAK